MKRELHLSFSRLFGGLARRKKPDLSFNPAQSPTVGADTSSCDKVFGHSERGLAEIESLLVRTPELAEHAKAGLASLEMIRPTEYQGIEGFKVFRDAVVAQWRASGVYIAPSAPEWWEDRVKLLEESIEAQCGLVELTVHDVYKTILDYHGLWTDEAVRFLMMDNLYCRCELNILDMNWIRLKMREKVPQGKLVSADQSAEFLHYLSDNAGELTGKRLTDRVADKIRFGLNLPQGLEKLIPQAWEEFLRTERGQRIGACAVALWFDDDVATNPLVKEPLTDVMLDPFYQEFKADPYGTMAKEVALSEGR
ncbi:MAG: hypothetical protein C4584_02805 [Armatimonadetes bacterium]|nr:MAG: hypothetical protein C4584_02805 [Armatimonadota bacterium]